VAGARETERWNEIRFEKPTRAPTREGDVIVPALQAVISGALTAAGVGFVTTLLAIWQHWPWYVVPVGAFAGGLTMAILQWTELLNDSRRLLREVETWIREDLDGDGHVGEPEDDGVHLEVGREREDGKSAFFADLPISPVAFTTWARAAVNGMSLAQTSWTGSQGLFSRSEYDQLLAFLTRAGVVAWCNPDAKAQGRELTRSGRAALRAWLEGDV
jgi:hypothetical protein